MRPLVVEANSRDDVVAAIRDARPDLPLVWPDSPAEVPDALADRDGPVAFLCRNSQWRDDYLVGLEEGDWVVTKTTGYEYYPVEAFAERGITFSNVPALTVEPIAEHVFALALTVTRRLHTYHDQQEAHRWERQSAGMTDLAGDTCCVVGVGSIGEAVAARARGFEMHVRGVKRDVEGYDGAAHEIYPAGDLLDALDGARLVVLAVPLTDETRGLVGAEALAAVSDDAIVVNVCRGPVPETGALVDALDGDRLRAACLDVVDERPPPADWPLWGRDDVVVTPHVAGSSDKVPGRFVDRFLAEYDRWSTGETLTHQIA